MYRSVSKKVGEKGSGTYTFLHIGGERRRSKNVSYLLLLFTCPATTNKYRIIIIIVSLCSAFL